jgi:hypothetical protein
MRYHYEGQLGADDVKRHIAHSFNLPAGHGRLTIRLQYAPAIVGEASNRLCLSLFDPTGWRGAGHRGGVVHDVEISAAYATPGYIAGPLPAGRWSVVIDTFMVLPGAPCTYTLEIESLPLAVDTVAPLPPPAPIARRGPGWYRGDLHCHTLHSDGSWGIPELLAAARRFELDFVTLTDHNTVSGLADMDRASADDLLTLGGLELTTYYGHALALGVRRWVDWRIRPGERTMPQIVAEVGQIGGLFVIAHPMAVGDPYCTGCDWRYSDVMPGPAMVVEIWNGGMWRGDSNNEDALGLWYAWLNQGRRMVATAGTDVHGPPDGVRPGFNVVYAEEFSEAEILRAVAAGRLYLSCGPKIEIQAAAGEARAIMGERLPAGDVAAVARWAGAEGGARLRIIADGRAFAEIDAAPAGEYAFMLAAGEARWWVAELRDQQGDMLAVTNPIFIGPATGV